LEILTGVDSQDEWVRQNILSSADFPSVVFRAEKIWQLSKKSIAPGQKVTGKINGVLTIKGVSVPQWMDFTATYYPESEQTKKRLAGGNLVKIAIHFDCDLHPFKPKIPEGFTPLFSPRVKVDADFVLLERGQVTEPLVVPHEKETEKKSEKKLKIKSKRA
jgi:hypothetical protein